MRLTNEQLQAGAKRLRVIHLALPIMIAVLYINPIYKNFTSPQAFKMCLIDNLFIHSPTSRLSDAILTNVKTIGEPLSVFYKDLSNPWIIPFLPIFYYLIMTTLIVVCIYKLKLIILRSKNGNWFTKKNQLHFKKLLFYWQFLVLVFFLYTNLSSMIVKLATGYALRISSINFEFILLMIALSLPLFLLRVAIQSQYQGIELKEENELTV